MIDILVSGESAGIKYIQDFAQSRIHYSSAETLGHLIFRGLFWKSYLHPLLFWLDFNYVFEITWVGNKFVLCKILIYFVCKICILKGGVRKKLTTVLNSSEWARIRFTLVPLKPCLPSFLFSKAYHLFIFQLYVEHVDVWVDSFPSAESFVCASFVLRENTYGQQSFTWLLKCLKRMICNNFERITIKE